MSRLHGTKKAGCRKPLMSSRARRFSAAENLEQQWHELRRYATIEKDTAPLLWLIAEFDRHKKQLESAAARDMN